MSETAPEAPSGRLDRLVLIAGLGITQVIGYGTLYYAFAVLAPDITREFGWSSAWTFGALSLGLLCRGLTAPFVGRIVDRHGAGRVMIAGSLAAAASLSLLALTPGPVAYYLALTLVETISTAVLYDAAFPALTQIVGRDARRAITQLTLIAGFASTLFWPVTTILHQSMDWRAICLVYAALHLAICLPIHTLLLKGRTGPRQRPTARALDNRPSSLPPPLAGPARRNAFFLIAAAFALAGFAISAMSVQMLSMLGMLGLSTADAVTIGAMIGPAQVGGRLLELFGGRKVHPLAVARVSFALMPLGFLVLIAGGSSFAMAGAFAVLYGISLGLNSILRGTVPLTLFGPDGYGAMMGRIAAPSLIVTAVAPLIFGLVEETLGVVANLVLATVTSALATAAIALIRLPRRVD